MKEILGNNLEQFFNTNFFNDGITGKRTYKGNRYEVWEVSNTAFDVMCNMSEEEFEKLAGEYAWWRSSNGSNKGAPDTTIHINGYELMGWGVELRANEWDWVDEWEDEDGESEIHADSLTRYLCDVIGASQPRNVCALAVDLAKYNNMTMGELFVKCEG